MDALRSLPTGPVHDWSRAAPVAPDGGHGTLQAAAADPDLGAHLRDLAASDTLIAFLDNVGTALDLAASDPTFGDQLDPLFGRLQTALAELPTSTLSRVERDAVESTLAALAERADGPGLPGDATVPGGGLQAHEDAGGHLIERHVGKSDEALLDRVQRENISASSSFRDIEEADRFVGLTLDEHQGRIDAWVGGDGGNRLVVDATFDASTGRSVSRGETQAEDVFSVRLVLERSDRLDIGYRIVTGYPSAP